VEGVQFHPESIMTAVGKDLLRNFLDKVKGTAHAGSTTPERQPEATAICHTGGVLE
jgi:hypothetical protein